MESNKLKTFRELQEGDIIYSIDDFSGSIGKYKVVSKEDKTIGDSHTETNWIELKIVSVDNEEHEVFLQISEHYFNAHDYSGNGIMYTTDDYAEGIPSMDFVNAHPIPTVSSKTFGELKPTDLLYKIVSENEYDYPSIKKYCVTKSTLTSNKKIIIDCVDENGITQNVTFPIDLIQFNTGNGVIWSAAVYESRIIDNNVPEPAQCDEEYEDETVKVQLKTFDNIEIGQEVFVLMTNKCIDDFGKLFSCKIHQKDGNKFLGGLQSTKKISNVVNQMKIIAFEAQEFATEAITDEFSVYVTEETAKNAQIELIVSTIKEYEDRIDKEREEILNKEKYIAGLETVVVKLNNLKREALRRIVTFGDVHNGDKLYMLDVSTTNYCATDYGYVSGVSESGVDKLMITMEPVNGKSFTFEAGTSWKEAELKCILIFVNYDDMRTRLCKLIKEADELLDSDIQMLQKKKEMYAKRLESITYAIK